MLSIALKAMAADPRDRYADVKAIQQAVMNFRLHIESDGLAARAEEKLACAAACASYEFFAETVADFKGALSLWAANTRAEAGLRQALLGYAEYALAQGELKLTLSLLNPDDELHAPLLAKARRMQDGRTARLRQTRRLKLLLGAAALVVLGCLGFIGFIVIRDQYQRLGRWQQFCEVNFNNQHIGGDDLDTIDHDTPQSIELSEVISDFQTKPRYEDDYRIARKLLLLIKEGMTRNEIRDILGEPSRLHGGGRHWYYGLFYSQFIEVRFNEVDKVDMVSSTLLERNGNVLVGK